MRNRFKVILILAASIAIGTVAHRTAAISPTITCDEIRPGMKGYGLTVFRGTEPVRFDVEVVSVVPNFLLRQDIILIRCHHPVTDKAGVIGGMSGSPIYLEGRLAGALAYGYRFNKEALAGVTPIHNMREVLKRKQRKPSLGGRLGISMQPSVSRKGAKVRAVDARKAYFETFSGTGGAQIAPVPTPFTLGGFAEPAQGILQQALEPFGMRPMIGGGGGKGKGPERFVPGGAIGVQLIRGDMSGTAIGTVTEVRGKDVLAFGHPMFNMGQGFLPVTTAEIHTVIASLMRSDKLGSPLKVVGSMTQDRNACIAARVNQSAPMIPVDIKIADQFSGRKDKYKVEIGLHRQLTPQLLHAALVNTITHAASDVADVTAELSGELKISGRPAVTLYDSGASRAGLIALTQYFRPINIVSGILNNPFEDVAIESLKFDVKLHYGLKLAEIIGVYLTTSDPKPGEVINVHVKLHLYNEKEQILTVPVKIPKAAAGKKIKIEVGGGDFMRPVIPIPKNLDDQIANVTRYYPPKSLVVGVNVPGEGVAIRGRVMNRLPASVVNALRPATGVDLISSHRTALRKVVPTSYLISGRESLSLTVDGWRN